ncbi:MAG: SLC13 family permease [Bryobacteraceae bacterium]|nr:SLC13 family permease [Bryobacteraceae bacterium]
MSAHVQTATMPPHGKIGRTSSSLLVISVLIAVLFFLIPAPQGIPAGAWHVLGLMIPTIVVWATEAIPIGISSTFFLTLVVVTGIAKADIAFSGFLNDFTWLMMGAFSISVAVQKTGLSRRMSYYILSKAKGYWGMIAAGYVVQTCLMAVPSGAARDSIVAPVANSIMDAAGRPTDSNFSRFLAYHYQMANHVWVALLVMTGSADNPVMLSLFTKLTGATISWSQYFVVMLVPAAVVTLTLIVGSLLICKPEKELVALVKDSRAATEVYRSLGPLSLDEKKVLVAFFAVVVLWITGSWIHLSAGWAAMIVASLLFFPAIGVLQGSDISKVNWNIVLMIGSVQGLGGILQTSGLAAISASAVISPLLDPLSAFGLFGIAVGCVIISWLLHFVLPSPNNIALSLPILVAWGAMHPGLMSPAAMFAFFGIMSLIGSKIVFLPYQLPPLYILLGMGVTDVQKYNVFLMKMYPVVAVGIVLASFVAFGIIGMTGYGLAGYSL